MGFHGSTCVLISMLIACDIPFFVCLAQASLCGFLSLVNKDFHYCCVFVCWLSKPSVVCFGFHVYMWFDIYVGCFVMFFLLMHNFVGFVSGK